MKLENVIGKDFVEELKSFDYFCISDNGKVIVFEHGVNMSKIIIKEHEDIYTVNFSNKKGELYLKSDWYLGNEFGLCLEDIINIISKPPYKVFAEMLEEPTKEKTEEKYSQYDIDNYKNNINIQTQNDIKNICNKISEILVYKNKMYGNSILEPKNIFYKGNSITSILIRLDDKIGRVTNSEVIRVNDIVDIIGYLVLLLIAKRTQLTELENLKD